MDVSSLTSLPSYGLDVTLDMFSTSSDVKLYADNAHISFGSYARRQGSKSGNFHLPRDFGLFRISANRG